MHDSSSAILHRLRLFTIALTVKASTIAIGLSTYENMKNHLLTNRFNSILEDIHSYGSLSGVGRIGIAGR